MTNDDERISTTTTIKEVHAGTEVVPVISCSRFEQCRNCEM